MCLIIIAFVGFLHAHPWKSLNHSRKWYDPSLAQRMASIKLLSSCSAFQPGSSQFHSTTMARVKCACVCVCYWCMLTSKYSMFTVIEWCRYFEYGQQLHRLLLAFTQHLPSALLFVFPLFAIIATPCHVNIKFPCTSTYAHISHKAPSYAFMLTQCTQWHTSTPKQAATHTHTLANTHYCALLVSRVWHGSRRCAT